MPLRENLLFGAEQNCGRSLFATARKKDGRIAFIPDTNLAGAILPGGRLILPFTADYLKWTPEVASPLNRFSRAAQLNPAFSSGEVHVIGNASQVFNGKLSSHRTKSKRDQLIRS